MCVDTVLVVTTKMTLRLHTLQSLQGELPHKLWQNVQLSESFDCHGNQIKSNTEFSSLLSLSIKAGLEMCINASLVGYPYILMQWF